MIDKFFNSLGMKNELIDDLSLIKCILKFRDEK